MQSKEIEDSIIFWANHYLKAQQYTTTEELLDGEFFYTLLQNQNIEEDNELDEFTFSMGHLDATLSILKKFYTGHEIIMEHPEYRDIVNNEIICTPSHVVLITELVIGVLLKSADSERWIEEISSFNENYKACLVELIQKMSDLMDTSPVNQFPNRSISQKEVSLKWFEANKELVILKKNNAELREWVLNLESENKRLDSANKLLNAKLEDSVKENDELYKKYEEASKNKDYEKVKTECEKLESSLENKDREIKSMQIQYKDELQRLQSKNEEFKKELEILKEKLVKKKNEVSQLNIYKRMASRMDEVDQINLDLKNSISQFKDELKEKDRQLKQKDIEISNLHVNVEARNDEIKRLKDQIVELEGEVTKYKNIKIDLHSEIDKLNTELLRVNEELEDSNKRLEYAEQMNFNEYSNEGLNFDLSERIKALEEQNEELRNNQQHKKMKEMKHLETKLEELENEKKELMRDNQKTKIKYERFEQEREARLLAKDKIKLLQKELNTANMEK